LETIEYQKSLENENKELKAN